VRRGPVWRHPVALLEPPEPADPVLRTAAEELPCAARELDRLELGRDPVRPFAEQVIPVLGDVLGEARLEPGHGLEADRADLLLQRGELPGPELALEVVRDLGRVLRRFNPERLHVV